MPASPTPGRKPFLVPKQEAEVLSWLARKPTDFEFRTDLLSHLRDQLVVAWDGGATTRRR